MRDIRKLISYGSFNTFLFREDIIICYAYSREPQLQFAEAMKTLVPNTLVIENFGVDYDGLSLAHIVVDNDETKEHPLIIVCYEKRDDLKITPLYNLIMSLEFFIKDTKLNREQ